MTRRPALSVAAVILAAGCSSRTGAAGHKLLAAFDGVPLVRRVAQAALDSEADPVLLVTGHASAEIRAAVDGMALHVVHNPDYREGLGSSVAAGVTLASQWQVDGVLMLLADMPLLRSAHLDRLIKAFRAHGGLSVIRASAGRRPGNPVLLPSALFPALRLLTGDAGAKGLIAACGTQVVDIDIGPAALGDVDTVEAIHAAGGRLADRTESPDGR